MANVLINDTYLKAIGEAIRSKLGTVLKYKPSEMATAINNIQTLNGGGYKVNITQSEHQTITVSQPSFNNRTAGFTIDDYPSINVSLKADPGYIAGSLNLTNFTFSNDVREVDIFATEATYSPNITYNGTMNVFLGNDSNRKIFCISNRQPSEFGNLTTVDLIQKSEFAIRYDPDLDMGYSNAGINNTNNFYNLDPNAKYKITNLKIGDTTLTDTDLTADNNTNEITLNSSKWFSVNTSGWFNSVYKQCTGIDLKERKNQIPFDSPNDDKYKGLFGIITTGNSSVTVTTYSGNIGGFIFEMLYLQTGSRLYYKTYEYDDLSQDNKNQIEDSISKLSKFFTMSDNVVNITNIAVLEEVGTTIENLRVKFKDNQTALNILNQYLNLLTQLSRGIITFKNIIDVDPDNVVGLAQELSCGIAQIRYFLYLLFIIMLTPSQVDEPIISTIPVSITFTNVTQ